MRELLADIQTWMSQRKAVALATVIRTWGSAPRAAGSKMAVSDHGEMSGSVSGGCVEAAVVDEALRVLKEGRPRRLHYGVADETAWEIGLACGGQIDVFVELFMAPERSAGPGPILLDALQACEADQAPSVRAVVIGGPPQVVGRSGVIDPDGRMLGSLGASLTARLLPDARSALAVGTTQARTYTVEGSELEVLFDPILPPPTLAIVGGVHIAVVLARLAMAVGYRVVIVDPRGAFATLERFPGMVIENSWPDEGLRKIGLSSTSAVAVLSHDPKLDDPALTVALRSPAFYVGALGSTKTQALRRSRLSEAGLTDDELSRLHGPIGIDVGRGDPEGIALGILTEIVATRSGRSVSTERTPLARKIERSERDP